MRRSPAERLRAAREKYERAVLDLEKTATRYAKATVHDYGTLRDDLIAAARKVTNATHEVGRAERAADA